MRLMQYTHVQSKQGKEIILLAVFLNDGTVIGSVELNRIDWNNRKCSIGIAISEKNFRGKGYGQQAMRLMLGLAFLQYGFERVGASTLGHNTGAQKALQNLGFILEGTERKSVFMNSQRYDKYHYGMLAEEFQTSGNHGGV